jgi:hypothetical protein
MSQEKTPSAAPVDGIVSVEIACVESVIENEIRQGCNQRLIAQTYALALRSSWPTDWAKVNAMILAKWPKGLTRIKEMAWSGKCFAGSR